MKVAGNLGQACSCRLVVSLLVAAAMATGVLGCGPNFELSISYEFGASQVIGDLINAYADKDLIYSKLYMYNFHAKKFLRPSWPPPEFAFLYPPEAIVDRVGTYDPEHGKQASWFHEMSADVCYDFFSDKDIISPTKPPVGLYRVTVEESAWTITLAESREIVSTESVYIPLPKLQTNSQGRVNGLAWTWWIKEGGMWRQPTGQELKANLAWAEMKIMLVDETSVSKKLTLTTTGVVAVEPIDVQDVSGLRMSCRDKARYRYGFEWQTWLE